MSDRRRRLITRIHLWTGLLLGGLFGLFGLTGSALVFYRGVDAWMHPAVRQAPGAQPRSWEAVYQALRAARPDRAGAWRIEVPPEGGAIPARYMATRESTARGFAPLQAWVDPASDRVVRQEIWGERGMTWIYDLHYRLLAGQAGATIVGIIGLLALLLMGSGLCLWWPAKGRLGKALTLKPHAAVQRRVYDLHTLPGAYGFALLAGVTLTGTLLGLPGQVRPTLAQVVSLFRQPQLRSTPAGAPRIPVDAAVAAAMRRFPEARLAWIETPADAAGTYRINLAQAFEPSRRFPRTNVWVDQYSGHVLALRDPRHDSWGDVLLNWLHPLHNGEALGLPGRLLVFLGGLLPAALFATGVLRWRHKARAHMRTRARKFPIRCAPEARRAPASDSWTAIHRSPPGVRT